MSIFKGHFYHSLTKKYQTIFGNLFQDLEIKRKDSDGTNSSIINVPVIQSSKEKFIQRLENGDDIDYDDFEDDEPRRRTALNLPMIAYEMVDLAYDGTRKVSKHNYIRVYNKSDINSTTTSSKVWTPVPYTLTFEVNIATKTQDDMLQLIEQIIPGFNPDVNIKVKALDDVVFDVPINFNGLFRNDSYSGRFEERRQILYTLNFTMKSYYFAPIRKQEIILDISVPLLEYDDSFDDDSAEVIETFEYTADDFLNNLQGRWR